MASQNILMQKVYLKNPYTGKHSCDKKLGKGYNESLCVVFIIAYNVQNYLKTKSLI